MSPEKAIEVLRSIYGIRLRLPQTQKSKLILIDKAEEQQIILKTFGI